MAFDFSVRVVDQHGAPCEGVRVFAEFGPMDGVSGQADKDGRAHLTSLVERRDAGIYIDDLFYGTYPLSDGEEIVITTDCCKQPPQ